EAVGRVDKTGVEARIQVDAEGRLKGMVAERDVRFVGGSTPVADRMTGLGDLVVHTGPISLAAAERVMTERKVKKLPLVNPDGTVLGLITAKDLLKHKEHPFATRDEQGRLCVAAA